MSAVEEQKTACAISILCQPRVIATLPEERGLLVASDAGDGNANACESFGDKSDADRPDFFGILLDPAGLRIMLRGFGVSTALNVPIMIEDDNFRARRPLVNCQNIARHRAIVV